MFYPYTDPPPQTVDRSPALHLFRHPLRARELRMDRTTLGLAARVGSNSGFASPPPPSAAINDVQDAGSSAEGDADAGLPGSSGLPQTLIPLRPRVVRRAPPAKTAASSGSALKGAAVRGSTSTLPQPAEPSSTMRTASRSVPALATGGGGTAVNRPVRPSSSSTSAGGGSKRLPPPPAAGTGVRATRTGPSPTMSAAAPLVSVGHSSPTDCSLDNLAVPSCTACRRAKKGCPGCTPCVRCAKLGVGCAYPIVGVRRSEHSSTSASHEAGEGTGVATGSGGFDGSEAQPTGPIPIPSSASAPVPSPPTVVIQTESGAASPAPEAMDIDSVDLCLASDPLGAFALIATSPSAGTSAILPPVSSSVSPTNPAVATACATTLGGWPFSLSQLSEPSSSYTHTSVSSCSTSASTSASAALEILADASFHSPPASTSVLRTPSAVLVTAGTSETAGGESFAIASQAGAAVDSTGSANGGGGGNPSYGRDKGESKRSSSGNEGARGGGSSSSGANGGGGRSGTGGDEPKPHRNRQARTLRDPACTSCRSLKKKCPGGTPCAPCARAGRECVYKCGVPARSRKGKGKGGSGVVLGGGVGGGSGAPMSGTAAVKVDTSVLEEPTPVSPDLAAPQTSDGTGTAHSDYTEEDDDELAYELDEDPSALYDPSLMELSTSTGSTTSLYVEHNGGGGRRLSTSSAVSGGYLSQTSLPPFSPSPAGSGGYTHPSPLAVGGYVSLPPVSGSDVPLGVNGTYPTIYPPHSVGSHGYGTFSHQQHPIMPPAGQFYQPSSSNVRSG